MPASLSARVADIEAIAGVEQELQTLSYAVSHDLSASVRHMSAFSSLIAMELSAEQTQRQKVFADQLQAANDHCVAMLEQLLIYSRVQSRALEQQLHDPSEGIRLAGLRLAASAEQTEISVAPLGEVYANPDLLQQATTALLDNAVKFRRKDATSRVVVEPAHDDLFWRMRVRDNGIGVEPRHRDVAFSMFRRLNNMGAYPGVGAGLAICRRIARRHGGEVKFLDCAEGACVELALPKLVEHPKRRAKESP